jgi:hypothetical protein
LTRSLKKLPQSSFYLSARNSLGIALYGRRVAAALNLDCLTTDDFACGSIGLALKTIARITDYTLLDC